MSQVDVARIMVMLAAAYPRTGVTEATMAIYAEMLSDLPPKFLETAVLDHIASNRYFPTIAELRDRVKELQPGGLPSPAEAWELVCQEIKRIGTYGIPQFDCSVVTRAVKTIGWRELCCSENPGVDRAHFFKVYEQLRNQEERKVYLHPSVKRLLGGGDQDAATIGMDKTRQPTKLFPVLE